MNNKANYAKSVDKWNIRPIREYPADFRLQIYPEIRLAKNGKNIWKYKLRFKNLKDLDKLFQILETHNFRFDIFLPFMASRRVAKVQLSYLPPDITNISWIFAYLANISFIYTFRIICLDIHRIFLYSAGGVSRDVGTVVGEQTFLYPILSRG